MSCKEHFNKSLPKPVDTLDLHGCSKSEAISRTTDFLHRSIALMDSENAWVLIITGSGAHSLDGPALRGAVEALLTKRKIEYYLMKGKGSFLVNAASGFELYEPSQPRDSKVIVAPNNSASVLSTRNAQRYPIRYFDTDRDLSASQKALKKQFHNRCKELAAVDEAISKSSLEENERIQEEEDEKQLLDRVVNLSILDKQKVTDEESNLCRAIELSKQESIVREMDEEEQIRKSIALSNMEFDYQQRDPDSCLQQAIEMSRKDSKKQIDNEMLSMYEDCAFNREQDEGFLKALELSVLEF